MTVKREASLELPLIMLRVAPLKIKAYDKDGAYVGTLYLTRAGLSAHCNNYKIGDFSWEHVFKVLRKARGE